MHRYAIWGTATTPEHEAWVRRIGGAFEADGFARVDDVADADFVLNMFDPEQPKAFRRQARGTYSASFYELPTEPEDVLKTSYPMLVRTLANVVVLRVPGRRRLVHDDGARHLPHHRRPERRIRAPRAARDVEARDRQRVRRRPRARSSGTATRSPPTSRAPASDLDELDLLPSPFPLEEFLAEGFSPRPPAVPDRRSQLRQPQRAQGRDALLDERQRRRQEQLEEVGRDILLVTGYDVPNANDAPQRPARTSSRAASRSTRSSTG